MTATTIKVSSELRDTLKEQARSRGRTLGEHLQDLADVEARRLRFADVQAAVLACPPDAEYEAQARQWQSDAWN